MDEILEPERCETCGGYLRVPDDGLWRFAKGEKTFPTVEEAALVASRLTNPDFEFKAARNKAGQARIASRRRT